MPSCIPFESVNYVKAKDQMGKDKKKNMESVKKKKQKLNRTKRH